MESLMILEKCVRHKGKIYCWDQEAKELQEIILKPIEIKSCPDEVLKELLIIMGREGK